MPFWGEYWGAQWGGVGWIFPLICLLGMVVMVFVCLRMIGGRMGGGCFGMRGGRGSGEGADLRREVQEMKEEIRKLREQR